MKTWMKSPRYELLSALVAVMGTAGLAACDHAIPSQGAAALVPSPGRLGVTAAADTAACQDTSYDPARMYQSIGNPTAGGWVLWGNGYLSTSHDVVAGQTAIIVTAAGSIGAGIWSHMVVSVDGAPIGSTYVSSTSWADYAFPLSATPGVHDLRVAFDNDYASTTEDRNLLVAQVVVSCGGGGSPAPSCAPTTCAASGASCGSLSDGCGGTLDCGSCAAPQTCGGGGVVHACGAPPATMQASTGSARIMPLGDSITLGVNGGYRNGLWNRLTAAGRSFDFVGSQFDQYTHVPAKNHEGHPGFSIGDISANVDGWLQSAAPTHVLLMIGTNDVAWWCVRSADEVADDNAALVDKILADLPAAWVVVGSIPPLTSEPIPPNNVDRAQLGVAYNAALQSRMQARVASGQHVRFADVYGSLTVADLYDGVHPTEAAADKVAQVWYSALTPILP